MSAEVEAPIIHRPGEIIHAYGPGVHILNNPVANAWLAQLCAPETGQPQFGQLIGMLYSLLVPHVIACEYPRLRVSRSTRMTACSGVEWTGEVVDSTSTVVADIARGGTHPSFITGEVLAWTFGPKAFRRDLIVMKRTTGPDGKVIGAEILGDKMDGEVNDMVILFSDPMGATGNSIATAINAYRGRPRQIIVLNLITTPQFVRRMLQVRKDHRLSLYAFRLDRGMSSPEAFDAVPGTFPVPADAEPGAPFESGLDEHDYIVPGGGDFGRQMYLTSM